MNILHRLVHQAKLEFKKEATKKGNFKSTQEIKDAVDAGKPVCWANDSYEVIKDNIDQYLIHCIWNDDYIGLTWRDGETLNGKLEEFYIKGEEA